MKLRFFKLAEKLAAKSNHPDHKHGAVLVRKNQILGIGINSLKSHPRSPSLYKSIHAEFSAILDSKMDNFDNCELYIARRRKNGELANSMPCKFCRDMIESLNIDKIHYSLDNGFKTEVL